MQVNFKEEYISQIPALQLLMNMGYDYLNPTEAKDLRGNRLGEVVLVDILREWLQEHNAIDYRGEFVPFSDKNINNALDELTSLNPSVGLLPENERLYELMTLGTSLEQTIEGNKRSYSLQYINWQHPEKNVYHVTDEYSVKRRGHRDTRRPDIILFVNGIPLVVIECKRPDLDIKHRGKAVSQGIQQMIRNQKSDEIPHLFTYSQLVLSVSTSDAHYATTHTAEKFWQVWKEEQDIEMTVQGLINQPLDNDDQERLYNHRSKVRYIRAYFDEQSRLGRLPTVQDKTLYALLRPARLLELIYQFVVFDNGVKKICRYQQYFAIKATIDRVTHFHGSHQREGGVIWHTTGSGKSLTMVMLSKALALHPSIKNPRVILVTDRVNLDGQISDTFNACGKKASQATSGKDLGKLIREGRVDVITTVIDKFETAARDNVREDSSDIFVLVDESHRSQYGTSHAKMKQVFKNGCYIGFTGTPLLKKDKGTAEKFGGFIHKYTMRQAVDDGAVVPLLYEGRMVDLDINRKTLDTWFERKTRDLSKEQIIDLKRKMSRADEIGRVDQRIMTIAWDIAQHFTANHRSTGFKAQLATSSKAVALKYRKYLKEEGIDCEVVISAPDTREGNTEVSDSDTPEAERFWKDMMAQHGSEDLYNSNVKNSFSDPDGIEMLIVVDKLLVGFDEPRNTVLYIDKPLKEHNLLQAIARVNRLFEGKPHGYIIDYRGVLGDLNEAMETYNALEGYDLEDVAGTVIDISKILDELPQHHEQLCDFFKSVNNQQDSEAMWRYLEPEDRRDKFYDFLNTFAGSLKVALGSEVFYDNTPEKRVQVYKNDLKFFHSLRQSVKQRYSETVDYREYEDKVRKLMDSHIQADGIMQITALVNIFDVDAFDAEVARVTGENAKADTILHRLKKTAHERMDEDPAFYRKFSQMIEETLQAYRDGRINDAEKLQQASDYLEQMRDGKDTSLPILLHQRPHASAYFGELQDIWESANIRSETDDLVQLAIVFEDVIENKKIRDWITNADIKSRIKNELEDCLDKFQDEFSVSISNSSLSVIIEKILAIAIQRDNLSS